MALLTEDIRKEYFKELGLGAYNKTNIKKLQAEYMERKSDADGVYGQNTDNLLRHLYNCHKYLNVDNFKPEEFKCECNGRYCCGYPTYMKPAQLTNLQTIRNKYKKPMVITSGMRCKGYNNAIGGSISNSKHLLGQATDFYMQGVTDTLANRKNFIKYAVGLPNITYIYGDGCNGYMDNGKWRYGSVHAPYMGNAIHYDTQNGSPTPTPKPTPDGKLVVDGIGGASTVKRMQEFFGTGVDGVISGQNLNLKKYYPSLTAVKGGTGGSACIKNLQRWIGVTQDGVLGQATVKAWQKKIGVTADGIFGTNSMKAWQKYLNNNDKPTYPPTPKPRKKWKVIDVSEWQGSIDFTKVKKDGIVGVIIRYADGDYVDKYFDKNMKGAKSAGLHFGAYIFSRASNKSEAEHEATRIYKATLKYNPDMPLYIDLEDNSKKKYADAVAQAYLAKIKALGGIGGVYANVSWWNNYLTKTADKEPIMWVAQYYKECQYKPLSRVGMWQYSSSGSVKGISGRVDMNECYVEYWNKVKPTPTPTPTKKGYQGTFPSYKLVKTNAQVIADAIEWAKWIARDNRFHYGYGKHSHHNGCYFCGTQKLKKGHGIKEWQFTYCCNPFVGAAWAHGGGDATAWKLCHDCDSWGFLKSDTPSYEKSKLFDKVSLKSLKPGDVLCSDSHVALYIGDGKVVQAGHEDDNKINSKSWNSSINVDTWSGYKRAYRYNGKVNANRPLSEGEVSERVKHLKDFLRWYGFKLDSNKLFSANTTTAVKAFQKEQKLVVDGIVGEKTIEAMKKVKK